MLSRVCSFIFVLLLIFTAAESTAQNKLTINATPGADSLTISKYIYGHFSEHLGRCVYEGYWVGEDSPIPNTRGIRNDVVAALKRIKVPVIRWPGGCFADDYHWMNGIGPRDKRPPMVNVHWGGVTENNHFGTHEFFDLCELIGCDAYLSGNVGSGTVEEMRDWVEYITHDGDSPMANLRRKNGRGKPWKLPFFAVGNENWGCGGNMTAEYYANIYRNYQTYVRNYSGNNVYKVACGASDDDYEWTEVLMRDAATRGRRTLMSGLSMHYYVMSRGGPATEFDENGWFDVLAYTLNMEYVIANHEAIMDKYEPEKRIGLIVDEWGSWYQSEPGSTPGFLYQQNSLRDALLAGIVLNIFNRHCERIYMANIAQTVNVLQAMILTDGPDMLLTPTYHIFDLYKIHQDAKLLPTELTCKDYTYDGNSIPSLSVSASRDSLGIIHVSLCNIDPNNSSALTAEIKGASPKQVSGRIVTAAEMNAHNTFDNKEEVKPSAFNGARINNGVLSITMPPKSVVMLEIR